MSTRKPITDVKELIILSEIDLEKDSEKEIIYKFGLLMGDWNIIEISILADSPLADYAGNLTGNGN